MAVPTFVDRVTLHVVAGPYVKVSGSDISLTLGGVAVRGGFDFEQAQRERARARSDLERMGRG